MTPDALRPTATDVRHVGGLVEGVLVGLMIAGALSFPPHHQLWRRRLRMRGART